MNFGLTESEQWRYAHSYMKMTINDETLPRLACSMCQAPVVLQDNKGISLYCLACDIYERVGLQLMEWMVNQVEKHRPSGWLKHSKNDCRYSIADKGLSSLVAYGLQWGVFRTYWIYSLHRRPFDESAGIDWLYYRDGNRKWLMPISNSSNSKKIVF